MTFFEEYDNYRYRTGQSAQASSTSTRETWRREERKDYAAQAFCDDYQLEVYPEHIIMDELLHKVFDTRGEFVQSLIDGEMHTLKISIDKKRAYQYGYLGYQFTVHCDHRIVAARTIIDTRLQFDLMSVGDLWREFWKRLNRKRKAFGLRWMFDEFLGELEKAQGWR